MNLTGVANPTLLIMAKAPIPGVVKTRIAATIGDVPAAVLAAAALLDTLLTVSSLGWPITVAMTGDLADAASSTELSAALIATRVIEQRGDGFDERLANAHLDADEGHGVVQVGMDTPQLTVRDYLDAGIEIRRGACVIGPAEDGGWWLLGLTDPQRAMGLVGVTMSDPDTKTSTEMALGGNFVQLPRRLDMDTWDNAVEIADSIPISCLARAVHRIGASL